jgi:hypothetical protein
VNNHQAGTVDSLVDRNEQGIKPETYQGYRKKVLWKMTEDLEWIRDPRSSVENAINEIPRQVLYMCSPLRLVRIWRGYVCYLSARDLMFSPCVRGGSQIISILLDLCWTTERGGGESVVTLLKQLCFFLNSLEKH